VIYIAPIRQCLEALAAIT